MKNINHKHSARNALHTVAIFISMGLLLTIIGFVFSGASGALLAFFLVIISFVFTPRLSPDFIIRIYDAKPFDPVSAAGLYQAVDALSTRAGLAKRPEIYYLPSPIINSFTLGGAGDSKIILSDGLFRHLKSRELYGVLAHEISHVKNNDLNVMALADVMSRITSIMSITGLFMLFLSIPLMLVGDFDFPIAGVLLLTFAPNLSALLQMALSRTREFIADQQAVALTGDARGLASALEKIDRQERHWASQLLIPHYKLSEPSLLRTHPPSHKRIERLLEIAEAMEKQEEHDLDLISHHNPSVDKKPRHRIHGVWY